MDQGLGVVNGNHDQVFEGGLQLVGVAEDCELKFLSVDDIIDEIIDCVLACLEVRYGLEWTRECHSVDLGTYLIRSLALDVFRVREAGMDDLPNFDQRVREIVENVYDRYFRYVKGTFYSGANIRGRGMGKSRKKKSTR